MKTASLDFHSRLTVQILFFYFRPGRNPEKTLRIKTQHKEVRPATVPAIVHDLIVSAAERLLYFETTQNPESLGRERPIPPEQIAKPGRIGEMFMPAQIGPIMDAVVTRATVVEPVEALRIWLRRNPSMIIGIFWFWKMVTM